MGNGCYENNRQNDKQSYFCYIFTYQSVRNAVGTCEITETSCCYATVGVNDCKTQGYWKKKG